MKILVLGAGAMGSAITFPLAEKNSVILCGTEFDRKAIELLQSRQEHPALGLALPDSVIPVNYEEFEKHLDSDVLVLAVSSSGINTILEKIKEFKGKTVLLTKGFIKTGAGIELAGEFLRKNIKDMTTVGGPSIAKELANKKQTAVVFASKEKNNLSKIFGTSYYKVYESDDTAGVEVCSASKNVYAIAIGIAKGMNLGDNFLSFLVNESIQEMARLCEFAGGKKETAFSLAGIGDLQVTIQSGRNGKFGELLGAGKTAQEALKEISSTVEGVETSKLLKDFLGQKNLPIADFVYRTVHENKNPKEIAEIF